MVDGPALLYGVVRSGVLVYREVSSPEDEGREDDDDLLYVWTHEIGLD